MTASPGDADGTGAVPGAGAAQGHFDGEWYTEEDAGRARFSVKVRRLLHREASEWQRIAVYESAFFGRLLTLDDVLMFTERDEFVYHEMLTHVPLAVLPEGAEVLIIGGGDAGCLRETLRHPGLNRVVQCELDRRVTEVCRDWFDWVAPALQDPRTEVVWGDGQELVRRDRAAFDLVVVDSTDPVGPAAALFSTPFYRDVASSLRPGGIMTSQVGSPYWDPEQVAAILARQRSVFPAVHGYLGQIPTYQSGTWCWSWAGPAGLDPAHPQPERAAAVAAGSRYYNAAVHRAAFALPNLARRVIAPGPHPG